MIRLNRITAEITALKALRDWDDNGLSEDQKREVDEEIADNEAKLLPLTVKYKHIPGIVFKDEFEEKCKCGRVKTIIAQEDYLTELYTDIYLLCECGEYVHFCVPVK